MNTTHSSRIFPTAVPDPASADPAEIADRIARRLLGWGILVALGWWWIRHPLRLAGTVAAFAATWTLWPLASAIVITLSIGAAVSQHRRSYGPLRLASGVAGVLSLVDSHPALSAALAGFAFWPQIETAARLAIEDLRGWAAEW